jgi:hypothetical protein
MRASPNRPSYTVEADTGQFCSLSALKRTSVVILRDIWFLTQSGLGARQKKCAPIGVFDFDQITAGPNRFSSVAVS